MAEERKAGWSRQELELFARYLDQARREKSALSAVFERVAAETGRRPGSVHNFYYAQRGPGGALEEARVERDSRVFTKEQCLKLLCFMMKAKARGISVRAAAQMMAQSDPAVMMRLQNKYRSLLRHHPQWVAEAARQLKEAGEKFCLPTLPHAKVGKKDLDRKPLLEQMARIRRQQTRILTLLRQMEGSLVQLDRLLQDRRSGGNRQV